MISILLKILQAVLANALMLRTVLRKQDELAAQVQRVIDLLTPSPAVGFKFTVWREDGTTDEGATMATLRDDQNLPVTIQPVDKKNQPALLDGVPTWASSDETVATVVASPDGLSATISGVAPGGCRVVVTGDADLGGDVTPITGTLDITVTGGGAVSITITPGTPVDQ